jgi:hypothetical protein
MASREDLISRIAAEEQRLAELHSEVEQRSIAFP